MTGALQALKNKGGDVMDHPVAKPHIRFLELEPADLESMESTGYAKRHWFRSSGGSIGSAESQSMVLEPSALRCIRPALAADSESNQVAHRIRSAITFDTNFVYDFTVNDVYVRAVDAYALKHILFRPEDNDPHRFFDSAPAVYHLYSAARKYTGQLEKLPRGRSRIDQKRLRELKCEVLEYLEKFGGPFVGSIQKKEQIFKFIDPKYPWGQGAPRKPFSEAISAIKDFKEKYAYESFVTDGFGLIIYVTRWAIAQRFKSQRAGGAMLTEGNVQLQLMKHNFSGIGEIEAVTSIIFLQGQKAKRKTVSEKKPGPSRPAKR